MKNSKIWLKDISREDVKKYDKELTEISSLFINSLLDHLKNPTAESLVDFKLAFLQGVKRMVDVMQQRE